MTDKNRETFFKKLLKVKETDERKFLKFNKPTYEIWTSVIYFDNNSGLNNAINNWTVIWYKWSIVKTDKSFFGNAQKMSYTYQIVTISEWCGSILYVKDIPEENVYSYDDLDLFDNETEEQDEGN